MIMKKNYLKPELELVDVVTESSILSISGSNSSSVPGNNEETDDETNMAVGRNRGEWGNVWGK